MKNELLDQSAAAAGAVVDVERGSVDRDGAPTGWGKLPAVHGAKGRD